jgi:hypothetical protein
MTCAVALAFALAMHGPGESYSDAILLLAKETTPTKRAKR